MGRPSQSRSTAALSVASPAGVIEHVALDSRAHEPKGVPGKSLHIGLAPGNVGVSMRNPWQVSVEK